MHVVATAGHVDHGKSALVKALSGIDPDRLKEEQARQMTIDLGFAWAALPDGETIGIIDVPGHEDFVENMLAGVGGIDAVLFVVAADEGPKPQTVEHAEILGLLRVAYGVVALTKVDLVREAGWLPLVQQEVTKLLLAAGLPAMPQVPVSSLSGEGLEALRLELAHALAGVPQRVDRGRPRLAVDRVFSMGGFGTVATGTLTDGALRTGQEVEIAPGGGRARIRGLQTHGEQVSLAAPGRRLAVNLSGVDVSEVRRGDVLMSPSATRSRGVWTFGSVCCRRQTPGSCMGRPSRSFMARRAGWAGCACWRGIGCQRAPRVGLSSSWRAPWLPTRATA